jgi:hypothetical protein
MKTFKFIPEKPPPAQLQISIRNVNRPVPTTNANANLAAIVNSPRGKRKESATKPIDQGIKKERTISNPGLMGPPHEQQ